MKEPLHPEVAILNAALELTSGERSLFLDQACAGNTVLRQQVEALLQAHEQADGFLDTVPGGLAAGDNDGRNIPLTEKSGDVIGRYKLLQQIGEGGCGVVYMAEQEEPMRRRVALKIIKLGMDTRQVIARFEAERQALALMDHPNIARVFDAGATETGRPYFVMELVRGIKITDFCDENKISADERLTLFVQVCQAIQHAHQKGVIHRDIKPSNILVTINDGVPVPKVIDFGIAKATQGRLTDRTLFTPFEQFIGTPAYMSPEQAVMTSLDVDTRADIYSLGVLLYELITGRTPFDQKELLAAGLDEMRRTIREKEPPKPSTRLSTLLAADLTTAAHCRRTEPPRLIHSVRGDLDWIVMKALEKERARRYETANGLATDVQRHLRNEPVNARPPSNLYRLQKLVQRNRLAFMGIAAGVVALVLALVILGVSNVRITRERNEKDVALRQKDSALNTAQLSEQHAREELFASLQSQARARRYSRQMGQRLDSLAALSEASRLRADPTLRDDAIAAMALPDVRRGPKWSLSQSNCAALAFSSTYQRYAVLESDGGLVIRNVADGQEIIRLATRFKPGGPRFVAFSPDDRILALLQGQVAQVWLLETGESILQETSGNFGAQSFSPDSRMIALSDGNAIRCFDLRTGVEQARWKTAGRIHSMHFNPRDRRLAVGYADQAKVSIYDGDGREISQIAIGSTVRASVRWHPEGRKLAVGGSDPRIQIFDVESRSRQAVLEGHVQEVTELSFHPAGNFLVSGSWDGVVRLWDLAVGRETMLIPINAYPQFGDGGRWLGYFWADEDHLQLLEFTPTHEYFNLENNAVDGRVVCYACAAGLDDRLLAGAGEGVRLWDLAARREIAVLPAEKVLSVVFEPDGHAMLTGSALSGLLRWPIRQNETNAAELLVGPARQIKLPFPPQIFSWDRDVTKLGIVNAAVGKAGVVDLKSGTLRGGLLPHVSAGFVALSPDARWMATSGWHSERVRLWNAESGAMIREWVPGIQTRVAFTPDSQELIIARAGEFSFWNVERLEPSRTLRREVGLYPGDPFFSLDGKLMAMEMAPGVIHLKEVSTGRTLAQLTDPTSDRTTRMTFSSDGTKLIAVSTYSFAVHVWDLRAIRVRLKTMGLDWDWPEFPPVDLSRNTQFHSGRAGLRVRIIHDGTE